MTLQPLGPEVRDHAPGQTPPQPSAGEGEALLREVRRSYLDALPIAAALVERRNGRTALVDQNLAFVRLEALSIRSDARRPLLLRPGLCERLDTFLSGDRQASEFTWADEDASTCRHFEVRLGRMPAALEARFCLLSLVDRTAEVETQRSLRAEILHDSLTGLPNRAAFTEAVEAAIAADEAVAVLVIDLTRFSRVNESLGSTMGDELIVTVARRLVRAIRGGDMIARLGGDEFGILLHLRNGRGDAVEVADRVRRALSTPFRLSELEIRIDCAVGCALLSDRISVSEDLVRNALFALKRAKQSGRLEIYQPGEVNAVRRRFSLETELRRAVEGEQLSLAYQPLIDLQTGRLRGFEALARWNHAHRGPISPAEFIPVAEESGLIVPLGRWAAQEAAQALARWDARAGRVLPLTVAVNVSALQIARDDVAALLETALATSGIDGARMTVELTESAIIADPQRAGRALNAVKDLKLRIAMDDFGTGYSNLAYLQKLPIDILKIDRSFVTPMLADPDSAAIVRAVLSLAEALGMRTTAEGVETAELAEALAMLGCSTGQGYHFAAALDDDAAYAFWESRNA